MKYFSFYEDIEPNDYSQYGSDNRNGQFMIWRLFIVFDCDIFRFSFSKF